MKTNTKERKKKYKGRKKNTKKENLTVTASLSRDSPKTTMYKISLTWISSKTASTATGSTADMREANINVSKNFGVSESGP